MLHSIRGVITGKKGNTLYLTSGELEWEISCSQMSLHALAPVGERTKVYLYLLHRADTLELFGFATLNERELFLSLLSVSGLGPKGALKILSGASPTTIIELLEQENVENLAALPGIGKKGAQRMILQLRGKIVKMPQESFGQRDRDLAISLAEMGFDEQQVGIVLTELFANQEIQKLTNEEREGEIMRRAIARLSQMER